MYKIETLIVGGGMAGLGAARTFLQHDYHDFLLVTDAIGGRVLSSTDGEINYGAFYVRKDYKHVLPFVSLKRRLGIRDSIFINNGGKRKIFSWQNIAHALPALKLIAILYLFAWRYRLLRRRCEYMSPSKALAQDLWAKRLYQQPAQEFIERHGLQFWSDNFLNPMITATVFLDIKDVSAATMLTSLLPIVIPSWQFTFHTEKVTEGIKHKIHEGTVITFIEKQDSTWMVKDTKGVLFKCKNLILAIPISEAKKLIPLNSPINNPLTAIVVHAQGVLKEKYIGYHLTFFSQESPVLWIADAGSGNYLFYPRNENYDLADYFITYEVMHKQNWDPAFFLGRNITTIDQGNGLYLIGGHNFASMEDAYISGMYAANQLLGRS